MHHLIHGNIFILTNALLNPLPSSCWGEIIYTLATSLNPHAGCSLTHFHLVSEGATIWSIATSPLCYA